MEVKGDAGYPLPIEKNFVTTMPLKQVKAIEFRGEGIITVLESITTWMKGNPDASVIDIKVDPGEEYETITLFYE